MRYKSKKGTVINIPDGLSPKQIAAIKADADSGYGTRAQKTANELGKKLGTSKTPKTVGGEEKKDLSLGDKGTFDPEKGKIDPGKIEKVIEEKEKTDFSTNFNAEHPQKITDQYGNSRTIIRNADGTVTVQDEAGGTAKLFQSLAEAAASTFNGSVSRKAAYDAEFGQRSKYLDRNMARDEEEAKQELANRGIAYDPAAVHDPNTKNLYGRTIGGIKENYAGQYKDAADNATIAGNQAYATDAAARDSFISAITSGASTFAGNFGQYGNTTTTNNADNSLGIAGMTVDQIMAKYGIDKAAATQRLAIAKQGAGGGGGGSGGDSGGFEILG